MHSPRILIVGAGISGLSLAFRLQERLPNAQITVLERAERPGGVAWTLREAGFVIETGPNGFLDTKPTTLGLSRDLGLGTLLTPASDAAAKNRYLAVGGRLRALPGDVRSFLLTDLLSWRGKLSLLWERFRPRRTASADESIDAFARRRAGREVADTFADALVTGIFAGDPKLLSLPACFPRLAELEREHGSITKGMAVAAKKREQNAAMSGDAEPTGKMWSFDGGIRVLIEGLAAHLRQPPSYGVTIRSLRKTGDPRRPTWRVQGDGSDAWEADAIILASPAYRQSAMLAELDAELAREIAGIAYNRLVVAAIGFRQTDVPITLDGFGFIVPQSTRRDVLGVQWCSSIFPQRTPAGCVLLRAMCGGWQRPDIADWDDQRILESLRAELRQSMRIHAVPFFHKILRYDHAIPQYHLGHRDRLARIEACRTRHPGLFLGGNAYHGVALNDCTEQALLLTERVWAYFRDKNDAFSG
jgi:oxygen-dependent protoporphyrinogen oxidase